MNRRGEGRAYFIAARAGADFYRTVIEETGVERVLDAPLPTGVTAQARSDGANDHVFVLNCDPHGAVVELDCGPLELDPHGVMVFERPRKVADAS